MIITFLKYLFIHLNIIANGIGVEGAKSLAEMIGENTFLLCLILAGSIHNSFFLFIFFFLEKKQTQIR